MSPYGQHLQSRCYLKIITKGGREFGRRGGGEVYVTLALECVMRLCVYARVSLCVFIISIYTEFNSCYFIYICYNVLSL